MRTQTIYRPAIILCTLFFATALTFGCTDADLVAPERESEAEIDDAAITNNGGVQIETANVFGQGPDGDVVAEDGATIRRTPNGISVKVQMPTPPPGSYNYPAPYTEGGFPTVALPGHPEVFTLWVFADGVPFLGGGHAVGGKTLTLSGHVSKNTEPFAPEGEDPPEPPENISDAEVHIAIAPHGALDDEIMPEQIKTPGGAPEHWWFAEFE